MKKGILIFASLILLICFVFVACSDKDKNNDKSKKEDSTKEAVSDLLEDNNVEYGFENEEVTNDKGKAVTNKNGEKETQLVQVQYKKNKKDKYVAVKIGDDGEPVTDKKGKDVTVKSDYADSLNGETTTTKKADVSIKNNNTTAHKPDSDSTLPTAATTDKTTTAPTTDKNVNVTKDEGTTAFDGSQVVPKTSDSGKEVYFSNEDYQTVASMLEVPYLYNSSYENEDGVPINTAAYTAVWMAQHAGESAAVYPSSPVVLNLFKFYGQTVVNFKTKCNDTKDSPIKYNKSDDTFTVNKYNEKKQSVIITKVEDMGNDNFYKVTGDVSGAGDIKKVVAIIQKNKLEPTLGFSIKALKWS